MISYLRIKGFKSFHDFEIEFSPFTVIAGINASGKSNLFDALTLLSKLAETDNIKKAFNEQRGGFLELFTQYGENKYATEMEFEADMLVEKNVTDAWGKTGELKHTRLKYYIKIKRYTNASGLEDIEVIEESLNRFIKSQDKWFQVKVPKEKQDIWYPKVPGGRAKVFLYTTEENGVPTVILPQDGTKGNKRRYPLKNATRSVLSSIDSVDFRHAYAAKEEMKSWRFLQLNPDDLRKATSKNTGEDVISVSGKNLAAVLHRIKVNDSYSLVEISRKLQTFLPVFSEVDVIDDEVNKLYVIKLKDNEGKEYSSRVLSEGTLRILALCILEYDDKHGGLLCFEEPENGIHPYRIKDMVNLLKDLSTSFESDMPLRQVIVNTHSPLLVGHISEWLKEDNFVSLWYANMVTKVIETEGSTKMSFMETKILPAISEIGKQLSIIEPTDQEKKIAVSSIQNYLKTIPSSS